MFVVLRGSVMVTLEPSGQQVATITTGGFFGEMSMLTGDPRTATVRAVDDVQVLEIAAADMRRLAQSTPGLLEHISKVVAARRAGLAQAEATAAAAAAEHAQTPQTLAGADSGLSAALESGDVVTGDLAIGSMIGDRQIPHSTHSNTSFPSRVDVDDDAGAVALDVRGASARSASRPGRWQRSRTESASP